MKTIRLLVSVYLIAMFILKPDTLLSALAAPDSALSMKVTCPSRVYMGDSFVCQVDLFNNDSVSHNYVLSCIVDNLSDFNPTPMFNSSGTIQPYETITLTPSFVFSHRGPHFIMFDLYQDSTLVYHSGVGSAITVEVIKVDSSLFYQINPNPIYPNSSFSVNFMVTNEGDEIINYTKIKVTAVPPSMNNKTQIRSSPSADLGMILPKAFKNTTFLFDVTSDTPPGIYSLKVQTDFWDLTDNNYLKVYYVPIEVCSRETPDDFSLLESKVENELDTFKYNLGMLQQTLSVIAAALLAVAIALAIYNYWHAGRLAQIKRRTAG
jgi:hypothetical protein